MTQCNARFFGVTFYSQLPAYVEGFLKREEEQMVKLHLDQCELCRVEGCRLVDEKMRREGKQEEWEAEEKYPSMYWL